jgi:hypothetical protein
MWPFVYAVICAVVIAFGAAWLLNTQQETAAVAFATSATRVGDPGHNLVGPYDSSIASQTNPDGQPSGGI